VAYFEAKMHQIRFWLGLHPEPAGGAFSAPPNLLVRFQERTSKGKGGEGKRYMREGKTGKGWVEKE